MVYAHTLTERDAEIENIWLFPEKAPLAGHEIIRRCSLLDSLESEMALRNATKHWLLL